jgi:DNA replication protein DnaC
VAPHRGKRAPQGEGYQGAYDTGKTHVATALGVAAIHQNKRVQFFNAVDWVNQLEREKQQGKAGNLAKQLVQIDAVILDE